MSKRIETIINLVNPDHQQVYDLCCDHGKIGLSLDNPYVSLIDQVPSIIQNLKGTDIPKNKKPICADAINYHYSPSTISTYILAGIGGHLGVKILENILNFKLDHSEIILCIHSHMEVVLDYLSDKPFRVLNEVGLEDEGKFYEIYKLGFCANEKPNFGQIIWRDLDSSKTKYLKEKLEYFALKTRYDSSFKKWLDYYNTQLNP